MINITHVTQTLSFGTGTAEVFYCWPTVAVFTILTSCVGLSHSLNRLVTILPSSSALICLIRWFIQTYLHHCISVLFSVLFYSLVESLIVYLNVVLILIHTPYQLVVAMHQFVVCQPLLNTDEEDEEEACSGFWFCVSSESKSLFYFIVWTVF